MIGAMNLAMEDERKAQPNGPRSPFTERGSLRLFVRGDSFLANCGSSLAALARRSPRGPRSAIYFLRSASVSRVRFAGRSLGASLLLHGSLLALLLYLPQAIPAAAWQVNAAPDHFMKIYYQVPVIKPARLPRLAPKGPGGRPGAGSIPVKLPALASTIQHPNITIVSNPARPDNFHQTIFQPTAPPDVKITTDQKLPNLVFGQALERLKAPLAPSDARPNQFNRQVSRVDAPSVAENTPKSPMMAFLKTSNESPKLAIPVSAGGAPIQRVSAGSASPSSGNSADDAGLLLLGVDSTAPSSHFSLPAGNRWGQFSIAPPPAASGGSPGGDAHGVAAGGNGSGRTAGDASTAVGTGTTGGGGGNSGTGGAVSISGSGSGGEGGLLDPALPTNMIYPVAAPPLKVRRNTLIISSGPMGGGGLNIYGALKCGKIYSVFLPMPGRNWTMQYCDTAPTAESVTSGGYTTVIRLENPLLPPDVDLTHRFNFKRLPVPVTKAHRSIVLKGMIGTDGTVQHLVVYQGVLPQMDEAARLAFSKWRFKPAMRNGKPVEVQILVGIPPQTGVDRVNR